MIDFIGGKKMAYIKEYWNDKEKRAEQARKHTKEMKQVYSGRIKDSIKNSTIYDVDFQCNKTHSCKMDIIVEATDSVSAIINHTKDCKNRMAVLNFSSYKNPGGMFINGSKAQEECLCHESCLYNVLSEFVLSFYDWNNKHYVMLSLVQLQTNQQRKNIKMFQMKRIPKY